MIEGTSFNNPNNIWSEDVLSDIAVLMEPIHKLVA